MAHHHSPNRPHDEARESRDFTLQSSDAATSNAASSSREIEKQKQSISPHENKKSVLEYKVAGFEWPFLLVLSIIAIGLLWLVLKVAGVF